MTTHRSLHRGTRGSLPINPPRYISAERLHDLLRDRLGCTYVVERRRGGSFWMSPSGRCFKLLDPLVDPVGSFVVTADGARHRVYSLDYVRALVAQLRAVDPPRLPEPPVMATEPGAEAYRALASRKPGAAFDICV